MRRLAITIGDPTGIGPEITAKALQRIVDFPGVHCNVIGDIKGLQKTALTLGLTLPHLPSVSQPSNQEMLLTNPLILRSN